jgi:hypothetical protein
MTVVGLDLNATRALAVTGSAGSPAQPILLDDPEQALPMALSLQNRRPQVGRPGTALCREYPHLVCCDFLAHLGTARTWVTRRHRLDASRALALVVDHLRPRLADMQFLAIALPAYLSGAQAAAVVALTRKAKWPIAASVSAPLAATLASQREQLRAGLVAVIDVDDHALTWSLLKVDPAQIQLQDKKTWPRWSLRAWQSCLIDAIAERCVRHSRRDPRDSGSAEQLLFDQLEDVLEAVHQDLAVEVIIRTATWCQNLILQPRQVLAFCAPLADQLLDEMPFVSSTLDSLAAVLLTSTAGRLPGLAAAVQEAAGDRISVTMLPPDAIARAAHLLAGRSQRAETVIEHIDLSLPLGKRGHETALFPPTVVPEPRIAADR